MGWQKSEIFFSTHNSCISNNRKLASKSSYSSITASTMKTSLIVCLSSLSLVLTSLAQSPAAPGTNPAGQAPSNPAAAAQQAPAANVPPAQAAAPGQPAAQQLAAPGQPGTVGGQPGAAAGMSPG